MSKPHLSALTGVRGMAALWVLIHHLINQYPIHNNTPGWLVTVAEKGWLGVDLFFILSGFVISYVHQDDFATKVTASAYRRFLILRFARIYPVHLVTILSLVPIYLVANQLFGYTSPVDAFSLQKFIYGLSLTNGLGIENSTGWNVPSWSVGTECFAYLLFPVVTWAVFSRPMSIVVCAVGSCASFIVTIALGYWQSEMTQYMLPWSGTLIRISAEFSLGCLLYNIYKQAANSDHNRGATFAFIGLLVLIALELPSQWDFLFLLVFMLLIWGLTSDYGLAAKLFNHRFSVYLGNISYSVYLSHTIVFMVVGVAFERVLPPAGNWSMAIAAIGYVGVIWLVSHLLYYLIEKKARHYLVSRLLTSR